ncbi:MAG: zinc ribbon domain-containing protein [Acidobacteria bacterium]|nr:zinc ribbon domain-containing protein [Acidobacteriota bacterium]
MYALEITETIGLNKCMTCGAEQNDRDKFCRRCGARQSSSIDRSSKTTSGISSGYIDKYSGYNTRTFPLNRTERRSCSDQLVSIVTQELSERTSSIRANRWVMHLVSVLVTAPLWLMIVLLSPLDAYLAAKNIAKHV